MKVLITAVVLCAVLGACTGDRSGSLPVAEPSTSRTSVARVTKEEPPPAQLQVGTEVVHGVLSRYCEGERCDADAGARPSRELLANEQGLLLFVLKRTPRTARVEVFRPKTAEPVLRRGLHAGTPTVAVHEDLEPGRYLVKLTTTWKGHEASWVFGLKVPRSRD
jgi:hypothetical protein